MMLLFYLIIFSNILSGTTIKISDDFKFVDGNKISIIQEIEIGEEVDKCTKELAIQFQFNDEMLLAFLNTSNYINRKSKEQLCTTKDEILDFKNFVAVRRTINSIYTIDILFKKREIIMKSKNQEILYYLKEKIEAKIP